MIKLSNLLNEASDIEFSQLNPAQQKQIELFEKIIGGKYEMIWQRGNEYTVGIKLNNKHGGYTFDVDTMKKLIAAKVRWVREDLGHRVNIGF